MFTNRSIVYQLIRLQSLRKHFSKNLVSESSVSTYDLIASFLSVSSSPKEGELDVETDESLRHATLSLLRLFYATASSQLQNAEQEHELLKNIPPSNKAMSIDIPEDLRDKKRREEDNAWKLDLPLDGGLGRVGPVLDASGRVGHTFVGQNFLPTHHIDSH